MEHFKLHILGCGSALPTVNHLPTSQALSLKGKVYLIDCGEGAQLQFRKAKLKFSSLSNIFISHLHGDHCFGLMGLISTFSLLGRTSPLHIYSPSGLKEILTPQLQFFCKGQNYEVCFHEFSTNHSECIFNDNTLKVTTIPLSHRMPCCGFLFTETPSLPHIRRDMIDFLQIPHYAINSIKEGAGWTTGEGIFYENARLVLPADPPRSYAYLSDTLYQPNVPELIKGVNLLFHESTFTEADKGRAKETGHSTAAQAAKIAEAAQCKQLIIGHFSQRYTNNKVLLDEATPIFPKTMLANEGLCVDII